MTTASKQKTKKKNPAQPGRIRSLLYMPKGFDGWLFFAMFCLMVFGIVMIGSASMGLDTGNNRYLAFTIAKQILFTMIGYAAMNWLANHFTLRFLKSKYFPSLFFIICILLVICLAFSATGNARAWIRLGVGRMQVTLQPSEFAKIMAMLIVAAYCGDVKKEYKSWWEMLQVPIILCSIMVFIVLILQDDFGSALVIFLITCVCFLIPQHPQMQRFELVLKILFWMSVAFGIYLLSPAGEHMIQNFGFLADYQKKRFMTAMDPFSDPYGTGYQLINGLISFATGGWFGTGYGSSVRKYTNFPAANTDYILAIVVEELGYVGFLGLMLLYGIILLRLFRYATKMKSERGKIIMIGTATYLLAHMFFNIGGVTGLVPLTGIPLLMVSAGGSSTMAFMACIGISQAVIASYNRGEIQ